MRRKNKKCSDEMNGAIADEVSYCKDVMLSFRFKSSTFEMLLGSELVVGGLIDVGVGGLKVEVDVGVGVGRLKVEVDKGVRRFKVEVDSRVLFAVFKYSSITL